MKTTFTTTIEINTAQQIKELKQKLGVTGSYILNRGIASLTTGSEEARLLGELKEDNEKLRGKLQSYVSRSYTMENELKELKEKLLSLEKIQKPKNDIV